MFRVITDVSSVVRELKTLELVDQNSLALNIKFIEKYGYKIIVRFDTLKENTKSCCRMIEALRERGHTMELVCIRSSKTRKVTIEYDFIEKKGTSVVEGIESST